MDTTEPQTSRKGSKRASTLDAKEKAIVEDRDNLLHDIQEIMQLSNKGGVKRYFFGLRMHHEQSAFG